jgi:hypothetical protein
MWRELGRAVRTAVAAELVGAPIISSLKQMDFGSSIFLDCGPCGRCGHPHPQVYTQSMN